MSHYESLPVSISPSLESEEHICIVSLFHLDWSAWKISYDFSIFFRFTCLHLGKVPFFFLCSSSFVFSFPLAPACFSRFSPHALLLFRSSPPRRHVFFDFDTALSSYRTCTSRWTTSCRSCRTPSGTFSYTFFFAPDPPDSTRTLGHSDSCPRGHHHLPSSFCFPLRTAGQY